MTKKGLPVPSDAVFVENEPRNGDAIIVFGGGELSRNRVLRAVELYKHGYGPKLVLSGKGRTLGVVEAHGMRDIAQQHGVPQKDIILEDKSEDTIQNAKFCRDELSKIMGELAGKTFLLVSSAFHMLRVLMLMQHPRPARTLGNLGWRG